MYWTGVGIAVLFWLWSLISAIATLNSRSARNLARVGLCYSWLDFGIRPMTRADRERSTLSSVVKFVTIQTVGLIFTVLSWISVAMSGYMLWRRFTSTIGAPPAVKEMRWKLQNIDMTFDQLADALYKANASLVTQTQSPEEFKAELKTAVETLR